MARKKVVPNEWDIAAWPMCENAICVSGAKAPDHAVMAAITAAPARLAESTTSHRRATFESDPS